MTRRRVVIEVAVVNDGITEGAVRRMVEALFRPASADLRRHGALPSSLKVKAYSRVVAAEFGRISEDSDDRP